MSMNSGPMIVCPPWCPGTHGPVDPVHVAEVGEVEMGSGSSIVVTLARYSENSAPTVTLFRHTLEDTEVIELSTDQAAQLHDALGQALTLLGGEVR